MNKTDLFLYSTRRICLYVQTCIVFMEGRKYKFLAFCYIACYVKLFKLQTSSYFFINFFALLSKQCINSVLILFSLITCVLITFFCLETWTQSLGNSRAQRRDIRRVWCRKTCRCSILRSSKAVGSRSTRSALLETR